MSEESLSIHERRRQSAILSEGISEEPIYRLVLGYLLRSGFDGELLEFGAGRGNLIHKLRALGFKGRITAVDIMQAPEKMDFVSSWVTQDLNQPLEFPPSSFDIIVSTEVIEHLENPRAIFREFQRLLRPGGCLLVTTPNQESIRSTLALVLRGHFVAFGDQCYPAHITALLRKDFIRICSEVGFDQPNFSR